MSNGFEKYLTILAKNKTFNILEELFPVLLYILYIII